MNVTGYNAGENVQPSRHNSRMLYASPEARLTFRALPSLMLSGQRNIAQINAPLSPNEGFAITCNHL